MDDLIALFTSNSVTALANASGIVGLIITLFVWLGLRKIKAHLTIVVRLPELRATLEKHASLLSDHLNDYAENENEIAVEIARAAPILENIQKRLGWFDRRTVKNAIETVERYANEGRGEHAARKVHEAMHSMIGELEQRERDERVRV